MKTTFIALIACLLLASNSHAQANDDHFIFGLAPQISWATGKLANTNAIGLGGRIDLQFFLAEKLRLTASVGGLTYIGKKYTDQSGYSNKYDSYFLTPIPVGLKYFCFDGLFIAAQAGPVNSSWPTNRGWGVTYAPIIGFEFGEDRYYDMSLRYDNNVVKGQNLSGVTFSINYEF